MSFPKHYYSIMPEFYHAYVREVEALSLKSALSGMMDKTVLLFSSIPLEKEEYAYAPGKWTIKELLLHLIDCERVFSYRALRFSRKDKTILASFEENDFIENSITSNRSLKSLIDEYLWLRKASIEMFVHLSDEQLLYEGKVGDNTLSPLMIGYIIAGHNLHHLKILEERYL